MPLNDLDQPLSQPRTRIYSYRPIHPLQGSSRICIQTYTTTYLPAPWRTARCLKGQNPLRRACGLRFEATESGPRRGLSLGRLRLEDIARPEEGKC